LAKSISKKKDAELSSESDIKALTWLLFSTLGIALVYYSVVAAVSRAGYESFDEAAAAGELGDAVLLGVSSVGVGFVLGILIYKTVHSFFYNKAKKQYYAEQGKNEKKKASKDC
jgi:uncharacterized membrane protein